MATAKISAAPITIICVYDETFRRLSPFDRMLTKATPNATPMTEPRPPNSDTPPKTTAATDSSGKLTPNVGCPDATRAVKTIEPIAAKKLQKT